MSEQEPTSNPLSLAGKPNIELWNAQMLPHLKVPQHQSSCFAVVAIYAIHIPS